MSPYEVPPEDWARRAGKLVAAAAIALALLLAARPALAGCERVDLKQRPGWVTNGAWLRDGRTLVFVDAMNRTVVKVDDQGGFLGVVTGASGDLLRDLSPVLLQAGAGGGVIVQGQSSQQAEHLVTFDADFAPVASRQISKIKKLGITVYGNYEWLPVGKDEIVSFSDFAYGPRWASGFLRYSPSRPDEMTVLTQGSIEEPERLFNRLGYQYIAAIGNKAYILFMGKTTELYESSKGSSKPRRLEAYPSRPTPKVGSFGPWNDFPAVMRRVERSSMPVGLYAWKGSLYVLGRSPEGKTTRWTLTRVSPQDGRELETVTLPTRANHLVVVPGARQWAFLEKGPVLEGIRQTTGTMLLVPASEFEGSFSGALCD